jgi:hypothetical protein
VRDHSEHIRRRAWSDIPGSLPLLVAVGIGVLWAFTILDALIAVELAKSLGGLTSISSFILLSIPFLLSGAATMLASRRLIGVANTPMLMLKRVVITASFCLFFGWFVPEFTFLLLVDSWEKIIQEVSVGYNMIIVSHCAWWFAWIVGGILVSLPGMRRCLGRT